MPEIESLKRQIDTIKREIANHESELIYFNTGEIGEYKSAPTRQLEGVTAINDLKEVLATLERLLPPF
jgi:hypothetical protein